MGKQTRLTVTQAASESLVSILSKLGHTVALSGDVACHVYGARRVATRVEAVILASANSILPPPKDVLKATIARTSNGPSHFFISPTASGGTLCYREASIEGNKKGTCVVDLVYLFESPAYLIQTIGNLPCAPPSYLLLQRLERWETSLAKTSTGPRMAALNDLCDLLSICRQSTLQEEIFSRALHEKSISRVEKYCKAFPEHVDVWRKLGFEVTSPPRSPDVSFAENMDVLLPGMRNDSNELPLETPTRIQMVVVAGKITVDHLHTLGFSCAIFGSLACFLYGNLRAPNDVDILALPPSGASSHLTTEELKTALVTHDPGHFFLVPARHASYQVLYFRLTASPAQTARTSCKVDLVFPGTMHLPALRPSYIHWDEGLPLVPFALLLMQKLQGWDDHRRAPEEHKRMKQVVDAADVMGLLGLSGVVAVAFARPWRDRGMFEEEFERLSRERVWAFCEAFPEWRKDWGGLGFV